MSNQPPFSTQFVNTRPKKTRALGLALFILVFFSEPMINQSYPLIGQLSFWVGYTLVLIGVLGRIYSALYIGGRKGQTVVQNGPFSMVRNPLYVFSFIAFLGICLQSSMLIFTLLTIATFCWYYPKIIQSEEYYLHQTFGAQYISYAKRVPRWIPKINLWHEPDEWLQVHLTFLRHTILDATILLVLGPIFLGIRSLHQHGLLYFYLP